MDFISNTEEQNQEMLRKIGVSSLDSLFESIPKELLLPKPEKNDGLSEFEGIKHMEALAAKNSFFKFDNYLGAGAYEHHVPALVGAICSKSEFLTAYTPYQAEASQGMLQATFEFQSAICALTGMDVANASLYDGASACAEALLMALRYQQGKHKVIVAGNLHPHYKGVVEQYLCHPDMQVVTIRFDKNGTMNKEKLDELVDDKTAAVLLQYPNFFGQIEDIKALAEGVKGKGALLCLAANPLVYGIYASAAELGVDIAVGDCQPFGLSLQFGGPYVGYIACRQELIRQLPGRIVGETVDAQGRRGFVLTLQAREQHIRREKATSNICTNQALAALASLVGLLWYGPEGIKKLALTNFQRASYLKEKLQGITEPTNFESKAFLNEFVVKFKKPIKEVQIHFRKHGIEPGVDLSHFFPELHGHLLVAVTETKSKQQLDHYITTAKKINAV